MTDSRDRILDAALEVVVEHGTVSLESAAARAGLTKPGVMYHFRTKEALMLGLVDHTLQRWESALVDTAGGEPEHLDAVTRFRAYVDFTLTTDFDAGDLVLFADPRLRDAMVARWTERMGAWFAIPADAPAAERTRLTAVRFLADGAWLASSTALFEADATIREDLRVLAHELLGEPR